MRNIIFLAISLLISCSTTPLAYKQITNGRHVTIYDGNPRKPGDCHGVGSGAVIAPNKILTAFHVVDHAFKFYRWSSLFVKSGDKNILTNSRIGELILSDGNREPFVVLVTSNLWNKKDIFPIGSGEPLWIKTKDGVFLWETYTPKRGDSGSAVLNKNFELVGVLYGGGLTGDEEPRFIRGSGIMLRVDPGWFQ